VSRIKAPSLNTGLLLLDVEWREMGYDRGIAISISMADASTSPVAKLDVFELHPHWHQSTPNGRQLVTRMHRDNPLNEARVLLSSLRMLVRRAGFGEAADRLTDAEVEIAVRGIEQAIEAVSS
jgi:hypothetical protein